MVATSCRKCVCELLTHKKHREESKDRRRNQQQQQQQQHVGKIYKFMLDLRAAVAVFIWAIGQNVGQL